MTKYLKTEPAAIAGTIQTGTALFLTFKPMLTAGQVAAIWAFSAALTAVIVRAMVQPMAKVQADDKVQVQADAKVQVQADAKPPNDGNDGNDSGPVA